MNDLGEFAISIVTGIIALAILVVIVSKKSTTTSVVQSFSSFLNNAIGITEKPLSGSSTGASNSGLFPLYPLVTPLPGTGGIGMM